MDIFGVGRGGVETDPTSHRTYNRRDPVAGDATKQRRRDVKVRTRGFNSVHRREPLTDPETDVPEDQHLREAQVAHDGLAKQPRFCVVSFNVGGDEESGAERGGFSHIQSEKDCGSAGLLR